VSTPGIGLFILCALLALLSAIGVIAVRSPIRAAMSLLVHIVTLSGLFITLHAHLLAVLQVLVYAGAVVVLFVFVIMLIGPSVPDPTTTRGLVSKTAAAALMAILTFAFTASLAMLAPARPEITTCHEGQGTECKQFGGVTEFSHDLYVEDAVPFELISVLLTVAIIGAIAVARGRSAEEADAAAKRRAEADEKATAQREREQKLSAEVAASGGH
jgi:NADH-quinone oxidoreductase subunit J